jgi:hypothetical protein
LLALGTVVLAQSPNAPPIQTAPVLGPSAQPAMQLPQKPLIPNRTGLGATVTPTTNADPLNPIGIATPKFAPDVVKPGSKSAAEHGPDVGTKLKLLPTGKAKVPQNNPTHPDSLLETAKAKIKQPMSVGGETIPLGSKGPAADAATRIDAKPTFNAGGLHAKSPAFSKKSDIEATAAPAEAQPYQSTKISPAGGFTAKTPTAKKDEAKVTSAGTLQAKSNSGNSGGGKSKSKSRREPDDLTAHDFSVDIDGVSTGEFGTVDGLGQQDGK